MKKIYLKTADRLATVTALQWIDIEKGQLDFNQAPLPISLPCAIVNIELEECENLSETTQKCTAKVTVRMAFADAGDSNHSATQGDKDLALAMWDIVDAVYSAMQGWEDSELSAYNRISQANEIREDGVRVVKQVWATSFEHDTV